MYPKFSLPRGVFLQSILILLVLSGISAPVTAQQKPNIVLINLDDADADLLSDETLSIRFPNLEALANRGLRFTNTHSTTPLCGPSRACLLRGQYAHNTNIFVNEPNAKVANDMPGGMRLYREQGFYENDLSTWMQDAGYHTMMVGKFIHGDFEKALPQGWDDFYSYMGSRYFEFFRLTNELPQGKWTRSEPGIYRTNSETEAALKVIQAHSDNNDGKPFFLYLNPLAPHNASDQQMVDVERYGDLWSDVLPPMDESYNELDYRDKVGDFASIPQIPSFWEVFINDHYRDRLRATLSFDDQLGAIVDRLESLGELENTYIFVTSDNGFSQGENRVFGKGYHFDHATRIPLLVAGPGVTHDSKNHLLAHIDLAPTIVDIAGGTIPSFVDGMSFKRLIDDPNSVAEDRWRDSILIENWETKSIFNNDVLCAANTMRRYDTVYTEHATGEQEYYNLSSDPLQLNNSYSSLSSVGKATLALQLRSLKTDSDPIVGISSPAENAQEFVSEVGLNGIIDAPAGVIEVRLALLDTASRRFWNGEAWVSDFQQVSATVNRTSMLSQWKYDFNPADNPPSGTVKAWVWGYDLAGRFTDPATTSFELETSSPVSEILSPRHLATVSNELTAYGSTVSSTAADLVRVIIRRRSDGLYFNGTNFQSDWTFLQSPVTENGTWSTSIQLDAGAYFVATYAIDISGAREQQPQVNLFFVE